MYTPGVPPALALLHAVTGYWVTQALAVAARCSIADRLAGGPRSVSELARDTGSDESSLYRLLRALAGIGVFRELSERRFELGPMGEYLRSDVEGSLRDLAIMRGSEWQWRAWRALGHSIRTGRTAFDHVFGQPTFEYLAEHSEDARVFDGAMAGTASHMHAAIVDAYDFSTIGTLVDVGGGSGALLRTILRRYPAMRGVLFDLRHVIDRARATMNAAGLAERCELVGGDFFVSVPQGGDAYLVSYVIHNWDDERAASILRRCREAMAPGGRILVCEVVVPCPNEPSYATLLDVEMIVFTRGLERTEHEYACLFERADLRLRQVLPTATPTTLLEAVPIG
jgi:ubiquinone/menaquinone biosynthesis C-methylase UbiE